MTKFYSFWTLVTLCCAFIFSLNFHSIEACIETNECGCDSDLGCNCNSSAREDKDVDLTFAFLYTYPNIESLTFTGVVVTPSQQVYETGLLSYWDTEGSLTVRAPIEIGTYTIAFCIRNLNPDFEPIELGRVSINSTENDEPILLVANLENSFTPGQQVIFHYVMTP